MTENYIGAEHFWAGLHTSVSSRLLGNCLQLWKTGFAYKKLKQVPICRAGLLCPEYKGDFPQSVNSWEFWTQIWV